MADALFIDICIYLFFKAYVLMIMIFKDMNVFGSSLYCYFKIPYFLLNQVVESGLFSLNIMSFKCCFSLSFFWRRQNNETTALPITMLEAGDKLNPPNIHRDHRITVQAGEWVCTSIFVTI